MGSIVGSTRGSAYIGIGAQQPRDWHEFPRDPNQYDNGPQYNVGDEAQNTVTKTIWQLVSLAGNSTSAGALANWVMVGGGGSGTVISLTGNSGGAVLPTAGNINVIGDGVGINIVGTPGSSTLTASLVGGGIAAQSFVTASGTAVPNSAGVINITNGTGISWVADGNTLSAAATGGGTGTNSSFFGTAGGSTNQLLATGGTVYLSPYGAIASLAAAQFSVPVAGTISNLYVNVATNTVSAASTAFEIYKNTGSTTIITTVPASTTGTFTDLTHSFTVVAGDTINFTSTTGGTGAITGTISAEFTCASGGGGTVSSFITSPATGTATPAAGVITVAGTFGITATTGGSTITLSGAGVVDVVPYTPVNHAASPYTVLGTDYYLGCDVTAGVISILLPNSPATGRVFIVKDKVGLAATSNITATTVGGAVTIDGATTFVMNTAYESVNVIFNGASYEIW